MGNEHSKNKEITKNSKIPEQHENGSAKGLAVNITSNGLETDVDGETVVQQNGGPHSLNLATESPSPEPDFVIVETDCQHADAPVISEIPESAIQQVEVKKSKGEKVHRFGKMFKKKAEPPADVKSVPEKETPDEDQTDVSLPATDPQPESGSSGDEAAGTISTEHSEDSEDQHQKVEISTQTDRKTEADISTQTGDVNKEDGDTTTNTEDPVEGVALMGTAAMDFVEETADVELLDNQKAGIIIEEVVIMEDDVYQNIVFRAERVEVTDNFKIRNYEEEGVNETEPEVAAESIPEGELVAAEIASQGFSSSLPKVVADYVEAVFASVSEYSDFVAANTPSEDKVITEENGEEGRDMSANTALIGTSKTESNPVTSESKEANGIPSLDEEPMTTVMETISEVVSEEPNPTPANQDMPVEELPVPLETEILVKVASAHEEVTTDDAVAAEDVPGLTEEFIIMEGPSNELITSEEHPEDSLNSPDDKIKPESIPEVIITDENTEVCEDVMAHVASETVGEAEPSPVIVRDDAEVTPEAAIDALSQELCATTPEEPAVDNSIPLDEEVMAAVTFVPLCGEPEAKLTISEEPSETAAEETNEEAIEALSNEIEAVPADERADEPQMGITGECKTCELVKENIVPDDGLLEDVDKETAAPSEAAAEEPTDSNPITSEEHVEESDSLLEPQVLVVVLKATEHEVTEEIIFETENSRDVPQMDTTGQSEPSVQEEFVEENVAPAEVLLEDADKETADPSAVAAEEPTDSNPITSKEPVEEGAGLLKPQVLMVVLEEIKNEVTEEIICEIENSGGVLAAIDGNSEDSEIASSDEHVANCVEAVLETIVEEIITEDVVAECELVILEEVAPEISADGGTEENESSTSSTDSTQSAETTADTPVPREDMEALLVRMQSACKSVVADSAYRLGALKVSSVGYSISVTIHVSLEEEQQ